MLTRKCDICGKEIGVVNYKLIFNGGFLRKEKDICTDCFKKIADEIKQADTPQTDRYDYNKSEMENIKLGNGISREIPTPDCPWK